MERDPILFAWRSAPALHAAAVGLALGLGGPLTALALLCLRDLVGVLTAGGAAPPPFLAILLLLPGLAEAPVPVFAGFDLGPARLPVAAFSGLALAALALAVLGWCVTLLGHAAQARTIARLRTRATDAILAAPPGAREDVRALPALVGGVLGRLGNLPALGILVPALALAATLLMLGLADLAAPRLVPVMAVALAATGLARGLVLRRVAARERLRLGEIRAAEQSLATLIRRMRAVRTHGAAAFERRRIGLRALADRAAVTRAEAALAYARASALALTVTLPALLLAVALWRAPADAAETARVLPGALAAAATAFGLAGLLVAVSLRLWGVRADVTPAFRTIARTLADLEARGSASGAPRAAFPRTGGFAARGLNAYDPATGERLTGVTLDLPMPSHVAILGGGGSGARALAAVLAGQIEPTAGSVTYGGIDLRALDPAERARRIAFAGGEAILIEGTLRQNLLYGARSGDREASGLSERIAILKLAGLDAFVYARGLEAAVDPEREPTVAAAIVAARASVRTALDAEGIARLVEPFDPARYNHGATVGENILFGEAVGPAFQGARLASHPYLRAVLEAEDLTRPLSEIGLSVARSTVEIFSDLPDDHPLFDAFSLFPAADRGFFEDLVARQPDARGFRRGPAGQRDRERLIGLALRYSETRHRFGLIDVPLERRLVAARRSFAGLIPSKFRGGVELYDPERITASASLEENLLFGRIAQGEAGAEPRVRALVRRVLAEQGLEPMVYRLGLAARVEPGTGGSAARASVGEVPIGPRERAAIDLVRCLVRRPDVLVVGLGLDERNPGEIRDRVARLRAVRRDMGLVVCLPDEAGLGAGAPFDAVLRIERNTLAPEPRARAPEGVLEAVG